MALQMTVHINDRLFDFARIKLIGAAYCIKQVCNFFRSIAVKNLHFFPIDKAADFFQHLVFGRYHVAVEHILVVLVKIVVQLFFNPAHYV